MREDKTISGKLPKYVANFRTDRFVALSYFMVGVMLVLQIALIVWGYFL